MAAMAGPLPLACAFEIVEGAPRARRTRTLERDSDGARPTRCCCSARRSTGTPRRRRSPPSRCCRLVACRPTRPLRRGSRSPMRWRRRRGADGRRARGARARGEERSDARPAAHRGLAVGRLDACRPRAAQAGAPAALRARGRRRAGARGLGARRVARPRAVAARRRIARSCPARERRRVARRMPAPFVRGCSRRAARRGSSWPAAASGCRRGPQTIASRIGYPGLVLATGIGWLLLLDLSANGHSATAISRSITRDICGSACWRFSVLAFLRQPLGRALGWTLSRGRRRGERDRRGASARGDGRRSRRPR